MKTVIHAQVARPRTRVESREVAEIADHINAPREGDIAPAVTLLSWQGNELTIEIEGTYRREVERNAAKFVRMLRAAKIGAVLLEPPTWNLTRPTKIASVPSVVYPPQFATYLLQTRRWGDPDTGDVQLRTEIIASEVIYLGGIQQSNLPPAYGFELEDLPEMGGAEDETDAQEHFGLNDT